ncbi:Processive diacylglycerol beta-glucosyltransferase [compost metagenome]
MEISDLLITKPGGMTCSEGLVKGIPMLFYEAIPGQEEENLHYFTTQGLGEPIISAETVEHWFSMLVNRYTLVQQRRANVTQRLLSHQNRDGSKVILGILNGAINKQQP